MNAKKLLSFFLSFVLIFSALCVPVFAAERVDMYAFEELDSAVYLMEPSDYDGIIELNGKARALPLAGYAIGIGGVTEVVSGLTYGVTMIMSGAGVVFNSTHQMLEYSTKLGSLLPLTVKQHIEAGVENGVFEPTAEDAAAISEAMNQVFCPDGHFVTETLTYPTTAIKKYDYDSQNVNQDGELTAAQSDFYSTNIIFSGSRTIKGTNLKAQLKYPTDGSKYIRILITNIATGVSMEMNTGLWADEFSTDYNHNFYISPPISRDYISVNGERYPDLGFWYMRHCPDDACTEHGYNYSSSFLSSLADSAINNQQIRFSGTNSILDYANITSCVVAAGSTAGLYRYIFEDDVDNKRTVDVPCTPLNLVSVEPRVVPLTYTPTYDPDLEDKKVHIPLLEGLMAHIEALTQDRILSGDFENVSVPDTPAEGTVDLSGVLGFLRSIFDTLVSIPTTIGNLIKGILTEIFVPNFDKANSLIDLYSSKFGWVEDIYIFVRDFFDNLFTDNPPKVPIHLGNAEGKYKYGGDGYVLDMTWYARYKPSVDVILSSVMWIFFLWRLFKRIPDILSGSGIITEQSNRDSGYKLK